MNAGKIQATQVSGKNLPIISNSPKAFMAYSSGLYSSPISKEEFGGKSIGV